MTNDEADIIRFLSAQGGIATDTFLQGQFGLSSPALVLRLTSLKRHLCIEQDRRHFRLTEIGREELTKFDDQSKYVPFEGRAKW